VLLADMEVAKPKTRISRSYNTCTRTGQGDCVHEASSETDAELLALSAADLREK
jgi:hypothetical protein